MTAKEYLMQIHRLDEEIKVNQRRIAELQNSIGGLKAIDYSGDKVNGSHESDPMSSRVAKLIDLEKRVSAELVELQIKKNEMISEIRRLNDTRYVTLLTMRYVDWLPWENISETMKLTLRHVFRIHGDALNAFKELNML